MKLEERDDEICRIPWKPWTYVALTNMGIDIIKHNENRFIGKLLKIKLRNSNVDHAPVNYAKGICSIKGVKGTFI